MQSENTLNVDLFGGYRPHRHARAAFLDDSRFLLMLAGVRAAKTHTGARRFWRLVFERDLPPALAKPYSPGAVRRGTAMWRKRRPRLHYWIVGETYDLLKETLRCLLDALPPELLEHADASDNSLWVRPDILIELKSGQHPERFVAVGLNGMWIDEGARLSMHAWNAFLRARVADKQGWMQCTTTPLGADWTLKDLEEPALLGEKGYGFHTWKTVDNTAVPALQSEVAQARRMLPPEYFRREYEAARDAFIGQIYEADRIIVEEAPPGQVPRGVQFAGGRLGGQDWGFSNPGAHVVGGFTSLDPEKTHVWILDEEYAKSELVEEHWVPKTRRFMRDWVYDEVACDPAEPDNILRYKNAGIRAVGHKNWTTAKFDEHERSVRSGIRTLAALIHQGRFHVMSRCVNTLRELRSYRWDSFKTGAQGGVLIERPAAGQSDHAATAVRYLVTYGLRGAAFKPLRAVAA